MRVLVWALALEYAVYSEASRIRERLIHLGTTGWWIGNPDPDTTFLLPWLLFAPLCFLFPVSLEDLRQWLPWRLETSLSPKQKAWATALLVTAISLSMNWLAGRYPVPTVPDMRFGDGGPYIHDEFSYRLQAEADLAGRWWWPGVPRARELFHQMHVLNEDRFASRYFPGTGAWLAPFVAVGFPVGASWLAGVLAANLAAAIVRRTHGFAAGLLAGGLVACAPGNCVINNLLLAHGPTLVGIMTCLYAFRRLFDGVTWRWAAVAGMGLTLAMLSRPLTAASMALPFGIWWIGQGITNPPRREWWLGTVAMGAPLLVGFSVIAWQNHAITGSITLTPYSQYNRLYTPRHVFAFREGSTPLSATDQRRLTEYDDWAESLTWKLAVTNAEKRLKGSWAWSLGIIPLGMAALYFWLTGFRQARYDRLLMASIVSLHLAHLPYWLAGIMGYHYVFESGPLWLMLFAGVTVHVIRHAVSHGRLLVPVWIGLGLLLCEAVNYLPIAPGSTIPRVATAIEQITHAAGRYERFRRVIDVAALELPAVVLVQTSPADLHAEYVRNRPPFDAPLLVGRYRPEVYSDQALRTIFPDRKLYLYNTESGQLRPLEESDFSTDAARHPPEKTP